MPLNGITWPVYVPFRCPNSLNDDPSDRWPFPGVLSTLAIPSTVRCFAILFLQTPCGFLLFGACSISFLLLAFLTSPIDRELSLSSFGYKFSYFYLSSFSFLQNFRTVKCFVPSSKVESINWNLPECPPRLLYYPLLIILFVPYTAFHCMFSE